jgi:hypothetical protein
LKEIILGALFSFRWYRRKPSANSATGLVYFFDWRKNALPIDGSSAEITALLKAWSSGDEAAQGRLAERLSPEFAAHSSAGFEE